MKNLFVLFFTVLTSLTFASTNNTVIKSFENSTPISFKTVKLAAGTLVMLQTTETLKSREMTIGQLIQFKVKTSVYVEGRLVIRSGALALGRVKSIHKATFNNPEYFTFELTNVQAIDGQTIELNATEQSKKGTYPNQGAIIEKGMMATANVMNDYRIKI